MNKKSTVLAFLLLGAITPYAESQVTLPTVYVTASKCQQSATENVKVVESITGETLRLLGVTSFQEALSLFSNLNLINTSGVQSVFMQGLASNQVKILIDGVTLKDPSTPQGTPLINNINIDFIDRIEMVSGGQSTLYGNGAMAGVINIITKKNTEKSIVLRTAIPGPHERAGFNYGQDISGYLFSVSAMQDRNRSSSAIRKFQEKDEVNARTFQASLNKEFSFGTLDLSYRQHRIEEGIDESFPISDDPNYTANTQQNTALAKWSMPWQNNISNLVFTSSYISRRSINLPHTGSLSFSDAIFSGHIRNLDFQNIFNLDNGNTILFGLEHTNENGSFDTNYSGSRDVLNNKNIDILSTYSRWEWRNPWITSVIGGRHEIFGNKHVTTYDLSFAKEIFSGVIAKYNASSGQRLASLYETYAENPYLIRNLNLTAEKSFSRQYSISQTFNNFEYGVSFFEQDVYSKIDYVTVDPINYISSYQNISGKTKARGTSYYIKASQLPYLSYLLLGYTHTKSRNPDGTPSLRIPNDALSLSAVIPLGKVSVGATLKYRGETQDTKTTKTKAYTVIDTQITYDMTANLQANVSIYNLQNRTYFPLNDYQAPGREILAGIIYSF